MKIIRPMSPLRRRMLEDMQIRNYSPHTIDGYLRSVAQFATHFHTSPDRLGPEHIRTYQLHLLHTQASESVFIQTVCALRFFYETTLGRPWMVDYIPYPKKPKTLPVILSRDEVKALILAPHHLKHRTILATLYATGVRVSKLCQLQGTDIDSQRMGIHVRQGKGKRDRFVMLSPDLLPLLWRYWKLYQLQSWLFPGHRITEPITTDGVAFICKKAGHVAKLTKAIYPHLLRHYAEYWIMSSSLQKQGPLFTCCRLILGIIRGRCTRRKRPAGEDKSIQTPEKRRSAMSTLSQASWREEAEDVRIMPRMQGPTYNVSDGKTWTSDRALLLSSA